MKSIDQLFKEGETSKRIAIKDHVWRDLDARLNRRDRHNKVKSMISLMSVAAAVLVLFSSLFILNLNSTYKLEDLSQEKHPTLSVEVISDLHELPLIMRYQEI